MYLTPRHDAESAGQAAQQVAGDSLKGILVAAHVLQQEGARLQEVLRLHGHPQQHLLGVQVGAARDLRSSTALLTMCTGTDHETEGGEHAQPFSLCVQEVIKGLKEEDTYLCLGLQWPSSVMCHCSGPSKRLGQMFGLTSSFRLTRGSGRAASEGASGLACPFSALRSSPACCSPMSHRDRLK